MNGTDSIQFLIDAKLVTHMPCPTYQDFDKMVRWLLYSAQPGDLVVLDTIGQMAFAARGDAKFGTDLDVDLWDSLGKFLDGDKNYLTVYDMAGQMILRRLRNLRGRGLRIITTAHETENVESYVKKKAPAMNKALYDSLRSVTSDVFRLWVLHQPLTTYNPDQSIKASYPVGTRVVQLKPTDTAVAKYHTDPFVTLTLPTHIPIASATVPTLPVVYSALKKVPTWLCLYGEQGSGKTTAAVSEAMLTYIEQYHPNLMAEVQKQIQQSLTPVE